MMLEDFTEKFSINGRCMKRYPVVGALRKGSFIPFFFKTLAEVTLLSLISNLGDTSVAPQPIRLEKRFLRPSKNPYRAYWKSGTAGDGTQVVFNQISYIYITL